MDSQVVVPPADFSLGLEIARKRRISAGMAGKMPSAPNGTPPPPAQIPLTKMLARLSKDSSRVGFLHPTLSIT
jgi:hypothetical protein